VFTNTQFTTSTTSTSPDYQQQTTTFSKLSPSNKVQPQQHHVLNFLQFNRTTTSAKTKPPSQLHRLPELETHPSSPIEQLQDGLPSLPHSKVQRASKNLHTRSHNFNRSPTNTLYEPFYNLGKWTLVGNFRNLIQISYCGKLKLRHVIFWFAICVLVWGCVTFC